MDETELDLDEPTEELNEYHLEHEETEDELWEEQEMTPKVAISKKTIRKPRKKVIIPPNAHPLEVFMLTYDFQWGEVVSVTGISKEVLLGIIRGDAVTEQQRQRIRLTTGVKV